MSDTDSPSEQGASAGKHGLPSSDINACRELGSIMASELSQVEEEIGRVRDIIAEAVTKLSLSFDQMYHIADNNKPDPSERETLNAANSEAVRALQFEDISTQALAEALRSVRYLNNVAEEIKTVQDAGELAARIAEQHRIWDEMRKKAVLQENLDEGSVDLF